MSKFIIQGGKKLEGEINISGSNGLSRIEDVKKNF